MAERLVGCLLEYRQSEPLFKKLSDFTLKKRSDGWYIAVEQPGYLAFESPLGRLMDKEDDRSAETVEEFAARLADPQAGNRSGRMRFLQSAPFLLDLLEQRKDFRQQYQDTLLRWVALYRMSEILLAAVDLWNAPSLFEKPRLLLLRQRYRYLASLAQLTNRVDERRKYLPDYDYLIGSAREAYGHALVSKTDLVELALGQARPPEDKKEWELDDEVRLLILNDSELWPFAWKERSDTQAQFTDWLLRNWLLARDDLKGTIQVLRAVLLYKRSSGWPSVVVSRLVGWLLSWMHTFVIIGAFLIAVALIVPQLVNGWISRFASMPAANQGATLGYLLVLLALLSLGLAGLGLFGAVVLKELRGRQILYLLVLRVPAMALVGILAGAGLADAYIRFAFRGLDNLAPALLLAASALGLAFFYILFEVQVRVNNLAAALQRAVRLWLYGWASTIWMAVFTGAMADVIGLTRCSAEDLLVEGLCQLPGAWHGYLNLPRFAEYFGYRISFDYVLLVSTLALMVGVFTQIFWEDKAIAEPL